MGAALCKLTLVYPTAAEESLLGVLDGMQPPLPGFTTWKCSGHGAEFDHANASERVRGRTDRCCLVAVLSEERVESILQTIKQEAPIPHMIFWIEPVSAAGRMA